jgi:O-antigen/teichoic acid export membrane protein
MSSVNRNALYLFVIEVAKYILPLITFPYLTRVLGLDGYGEFVFFMSISAYATLFINYGFDLSGTADVSRNRNDITQLNIIFSSILAAKILLFTIVCFMYLIIYCLFYSSQNNIILLFAFIPGLIGNIFIPIWFFQGLERMKEIVIIMLAGRAITIPLIFVFVNNPEDVYVAAIIQSSAMFIAAVISLFIVFKLKLVSELSVNYRIIKLKLESSWYIFLTSASSSLYSNSIPVLLGVIAGVKSVAIYNVAQTLRNVALGFMRPIYQAIFPRINLLIKNDVNEAFNFIRKYLILSMCLSILGCVFMFTTSEYLVSLIAGEEFYEAAKVLDILLISILLSVLNNFYGTQTLIPLNYTKQFGYIVTSLGVLSMCFSFPLIYLFGSYGAGYSVCVAELLIFIGLIRFHNIKNIHILNKCGDKTC